MGKDPESDGADGNAIRDTVIQHYNRLAPQYFKLYEGRTRLTHFYRIRQTRVLNFLDEVAQGGRVLEVGCGPGYMAENIVVKDLQYSGVDISAGMIKLCKEHYSKIDTAQFSVGDIQHLAFSPSCFDAVLCIGALEYAPHEETAIKEMTRVLKAGGVYVLSGINKWSPYNLWDRLLYRKITGRRPAAIVHEYHDEKQYRELLARSDLRIKDIAYFDFDVFFPPLDRRLANIAVTCSEHLESCSRGWLRTLGNGFLIKAVKAI